MMRRLGLAMAISLSSSQGKARPVEGGGERVHVHITTLNDHCDIW